MTAAISDRQLEIIEAAGKILTASGVSGLTIKSLAKEMQFSESAIYRHFTSKEEIILAMLNFVLQNVDSNYTETSKELPNAIEKLKLLFKNQFLFFHNNPHLAVAIFSDGLLGESKKINDQMILIMTTRRKLMEPIITEGQKQGLFTNTINADELIHIIMGSVRLQMYKWRMANMQFNIEKKGNELIDHLLELIKSK